MRNLIFCQHLYGTTKERVNKTETVLIYTECGMNATELWIHHFIYYTCYYIRYLHYFTLMLWKMYFQAPVILQKWVRLWQDLRRIGSDLLNTWGMTRKWSDALTTFIHDALLVSKTCFSGCGACLTLEFPGLHQCWRKSGRVQGLMKVFGGFREVYTWLFQLKLA